MYTGTGINQAERVQREKGILDKSRGLRREDGDVDKRKVTGVGDECLMNPKRVKKYLRGKYLESV